MNISLDGKRFRSVANTANGDVSGETIFHYRQRGTTVTATYSGGAILYGQLLAVMATDGTLNMRYHHVNAQGEFMLGQCQSTPEVLADGRLRLRERWQWLSGDQSRGESIVEEMR